MTVDLGRVALSYAVGAEHTTLALADVPRVACVESDDDFYAGVDASAWTRSVLVDGYNALQDKVAREVKAGRRDEALEAIREFRDETAAMNGRMQSAPVAAQLESLNLLDAEVDDAFTGADQREKQNALSKTRGAAALDERRPGSKQ